MNRMNLDFVVIGAEKAGSTYMLNCIREHPEIFMPRSEIPFFEDHFFEEVGVDRFAQHFSPAIRGQRVGMKRPTLLGHPECPARIRSVAPNTKLIAVLRDPVDRFMSAYFHFISFGFIPAVPIEIGIRNLLSGKYSRLKRAHELLEFGMYGKHLQRYLEYFPQERILIHLFEDIRDNSSAVLNTTFRFLGVAEDFKPTAIKSKPMGAIYSIPRLKIRNLASRLYRRHSTSGKYIEHVRNPAYYVNMILDKWVLARIFANSKPRLSKELIAELRSCFIDDTRQLEAILGRDLSAWQRSPS